jgi:serine protease Do
MRVVRSACIILALLAAPALFGPVQARPAPDSFADLANRLLPSVVNIATSQTLKAPPRAAMPQLPPGSPLEDLFKNFLGPKQGTPRHVTSLGSGFIIDPSGYIVTNNHVIEDSDQVTVTLNDGATLPAKIIGRDTKTDLALLKVNPKKPLPATKFGDSDKARIGDWVIAMGDPFGIGTTVTAGIVSARNRNINAGPYDDFIQTDAPINRGNSGGPLFDLQGRVVGINSQIYSNTGDYLGVSFSIPIDVAMNAVQQLKSKGYVSRGMLGVTMQSVNDDIVKAFKLDNGAGAAVVDVSPDSGAAKAGIQPGDIILGYNGQTLQQASDLPPLVGMTKPGTKVPVEILRNGKRQTLDVTIGEASRDKDAVNGRGATPSPESSGSAALGLTVQSIDSDTRKQLGLKPGQGVVIDDITGPVAAQNGLRAGDVILMVNQRKIGSVAEFQAATKDVKAGSTVLLLVRRGDQSNFIGLTVPDDE